LRSITRTISTWNLRRWAAGMSPMDLKRGIDAAVVKDIDK
jgi:hypothetical protein